MFVRGAGTLLLFTQNVQRVSIFHLPRESTKETQPKLLFEVTKSLSKAGIIRELSVPVTLPPHLQNISTDTQYLLQQCNFLRASSEVTKRNEESKQNGSDLLRSALTIDLNRSQNVEVYSLKIEVSYAVHLRCGSLHHL